MPLFTPRPSFTESINIPRAYFLGHHASGLKHMQTILSSVDLVIECRDYRIPLTSQNPLLEEVSRGREKLVVYTKQDLGSNRGPEDKEVGKPLSLILGQTSRLTCRLSQRENIIRKWHAPSPIFFSAGKHLNSIHHIMQFARERGRRLRLPDGFAHDGRRHAKRWQINYDQRAALHRRWRSQSRENGRAARRHKESCGGASRSRKTRMGPGRFI